MPSLPMINHQRAVKAFEKFGFRVARWAKHNEEIRLSAIRSEVDPAQLAELEETRYWPTFWQSRKDELDLRLNTILEDQPDEALDRKRQASQVAKVILGFADLETNCDVGSPTSKRKLLDRLQCKIFAFHDRIEIKALLPVKSI